MTVPGSLTKEVVETMWKITRPCSGEDCIDLLVLAGMLLSAAVPCRSLSEEEEGRVLAVIDVLRDLVNEMDERGEWKHEWE